MAFKDLLKLLDLKAPERLYFDHLYSEYQALRPVIGNSEDEKLIGEIVERREKSKLTWNDIYAFELVISKYLSVDSLHDKILSLRSDYLKVAGQDEFNEYKASNPPDVSRPPNPLPDSYRDILEADIQYLLDRLYLQYGMLPVREARLKRLSFGVGVFCASFLLVIVILIILVVIGQRVETGSESANDNQHSPQAAISPGPEQSDEESVEAKQRLRIPALPIFVAIIAGAMGGLISSLQRIQKPNAEGNSIYNLSVLFNASYSTFLSPLTGAVFAVLLYLMFTGKILEGRFFPTIYTPSQITAPSRTPTPTPDVAASPSPSASPAVGGNVSAPQTPPSQTPLPKPTPTASATVVVTPTPKPVASPSLSATPSPSVSPTGSPMATPTPSPTSKSPPRQSVSIRDFLVESGPAWGEDYALMIIWCFIAGFAERFVPDALDRLITGKS